jgi:hypothetical protein
MALVVAMNVVEFIELAGTGTSAWSGVTVNESTPSWLTRS